MDILINFKFCIHCTLGDLYLYSCVTWGSIIANTCQRSSMMTGRLLTKGDQVRTKTRCTFTLKTGQCVSILTFHVFSAHILLKHGAVLQHLGGRAVLEDVVIETSERLSHVLGTPPSWAPVLHGKQLGAQVVEPQHIGMGVVVTPVVSETTKWAAWL